MTAVPTSRQPSPNSATTQRAKPNGAKPVLALKELVASLYREQNKIQNLLSSLGFALRSFNNLNQFLELTPLMAARVTDADGGALILFKSQGKIALEQLHYHENQTNQQLRKTLEKIVLQVNQPDSLCKNNDSLSLADCLDYQIRQSVGSQVQMYSTPILIKNAERGRLYVFSREPE